MAPTWAGPGLFSNNLYSNIGWKTSQLWKSWKLCQLSLLRTRSYFLNFFSRGDLKRGKVVCSEFVMKLSTIMIDKLIESSSLYDVLNPQTCLKFSTLLDSCRNWMCNCCANFATFIQSARELSFVSYSFAFVSYSCICKLLTKATVL